MILEEVAGFLGRREIDDEVRQTMFPLWVFVHGAAFLSIDGKIDIYDMTDHVPSMITATTFRLLGVDAEPGSSGNCC